MAGVTPGKAKSKGSVTSNSEHKPKAGGRLEKSVGHKPCQVNAASVRGVKGSTSKAQASQEANGNDYAKGGQTPERGAGCQGHDSELITHLRKLAGKDGLSIIKFILAKDFDEIRTESKKRYKDGIDVTHIKSDGSEVKFKVYDTKEADIHLRAAKAIREVYATDEADKTVAGLADVILKWGGKTAANNTEEEK